ncbi:MAG: hypothetical protein EOM49_09955 [Epsilonproteobacteria bacterium]|nr:hypothetical protein [Campylobacterota bacterium]
MKRIVTFALFLGTVAFASSEMNILAKQEEDDIKKKVLFQGKEYYEKHLMQKNEEQEKNQNTFKDKKIYKKEDGTIDTFKTINDAKKEKSAN